MQARKAAQVAQFRERVMREWEAKRGTLRGSVDVLPSGRIRARWAYFDEAGKLRQVAAPATYRNLADAMNWLKAQEGESIRGTWEAPKPKEPAGPTLDGYFKTWLDNRRTRRGLPLRPTTKGTYRGLWALAEPLHGIEIDRLTSAMVRTWFTGLDPERARRNFSAWALLRDVMNDAVRDELVTANPCTQRFANPPKRHHTVIAAVDELDVIIEHMPERHRAAILLAAWGGLRLGELCELRRKDVDLDSGVVRVRRSVERVSGGYIVGPTKSDAGMRDVVIPPHVIPALQEHLDGMPADAEALWFPAQDGGHLAPSTFYGRVARGNRAGFGFYHARRMAGRDDLRFHDLRHSALTRFAMAGATVAELLRQGGHSSPQMAIHYQHEAGRASDLAARMSEQASEPKRRRDTPKPRTN